MTNSANHLTRRTLLRTGALAAAASLLPAESQRTDAATASYTPSTLKPPTPDVDLPIRLGIASYTFRNFDSQRLLIDFMKQLKTPLLNLKSAPSAHDLAGHGRHSASRPRPRRSKASTRS